MVIRGERSTIAYIKPALLVEELSVERISWKSLILGLLKQFQVCSRETKHTNGGRKKEKKPTAQNQRKCLPICQKSSVLDSKHETGPFCSLSLSYFGR